MKRDRELVRWVARIGAVELRHVRERFGVGRSAAYELVARLVRAGLIERISLLHGEPALITPTPEGIRFGGLGLAPARISPGSISHWVACADVALWAERRWGPEAVMFERFAEQVERKPIASAVIGELPGGRPRLHRPDLAVMNGDEGPLAIEVELSPKAPRRLEAIVRGWARSRCESTLYLCAPGETRRVVERAVQRVHAEERVQVSEIGELAPPSFLPPTQPAVERPSPTRGTGSAFSGFDG